MPLIKSVRNSADGFEEIRRNIRFTKAAQVESDWGTRIFVDYDNGADANDGYSPSQALANLATAITKAAHGDIIYIRPRTPDYAGGDPASITPASATNWSITYLKYGLSLIGTGLGKGAAAAQQTVLKGYATPTTPTLDIKAAYCNIENLGFKAGAAGTDPMVRSKGVAAYYVFGTTFYNCWFRIGNAAGGLLIDSSWYDQVIGCTFSGCVSGLIIGASISVPVGIVIRDCDFDAVIADVKSDISTTGAVTRILIDQCRFNHVLPTGGAPNKYINIASASTGLVSNSYFGVADATIANSLMLNGIGNSHLWGASAEIT